MVRKKIIYILFLFVGLLIFSCSPKKNTWMSRNYNSLAAHYNGYFNGNESFKSGDLSLKKGVQDDYTKILNLFPYSGKENAGKVQGEMERAIGKSQKIIRKYSITEKPKRKPDGKNPTYETFYNKREFNRWIDDAYMMMGKAHLYNQKYNDAIVIFDYVQREFHNQPVRFEAVIWSARARIEMEDFDNALVMLNQYDVKGKSPNKLYGEFMATYADYYIRQEQYRNAIPYMKAAAASATGKWKKTRWNYILGQLYMIDYQNKEAKTSFKKVVRANPEYNMNMNAKLNLAILNARTEGNYTKARKSLNKMARQTKNKEYRDRIYHTLAQTYIDEGDTLTTIDNLRLSAGYNLTNQPLKRETFLQLGELYFDIEDYVLSYSYYDSTLTILPELDRRKKQITFRHEGLKDLSENYAIIIREDSLQRLAKMDSLELDQFLAAIIAQKEKEKLEAEKQAERGGYGGMDDDPFFFSRGQTGQSQTDNQGQWYFYNVSTVSLGKMEFERKWGRRPSEDNWRRSDKGISDISSTETTSSDEDEDEDGEEDEDGTKSPSGDSQKKSTEPGAIPTKEELLADIPLTEEMMSVSNDKVANSYFKTGMVFYDHFKDMPKAVRDLRIMYERFPNHTLTDQALFWSYRGYWHLGLEPRMAEIQQILLKDFPDSRYTEFASDPLYAEKHQQKVKGWNETYKTGFFAYYDSYFIEAYMGVSELTDSAVNEELLRKSHILRAMSQGRMGNFDAFETELKIVATGYPKTQEGILANKWLALIGEGRIPVRGAFDAADGVDGTSFKGDPDSKGDMYDFEPDAQQYLILIVNKDADFNKLFFNLADYNFTRFIVTDYDIESKYLPDGQRIITVGKFTNQREVMDYFYSVRDNTPLFFVDNIGEPIILSGSEMNLQALVSSGDVAGFRNFFSRSYLSGGSGVVIRIDEAAKLKADSTEDDIFMVYTGEHFGVIIPKGKIDETRVVTFLTNHAATKMNISISVSIETLLTGEKVFILDAFESPEITNRFFDSLKKNNTWESQLKAKDWKKIPVAPENYKLMKEGKSLDDYIEFYNENY